jgi:hypothetical protein
MPDFSSGKTAPPADTILKDGKTVMPLVPIFLPALLGDASVTG